MSNVESHPPGKHILLDFWQCENLTNIVAIEKAMHEAAEVCGAHVLGINLHSFGDGQGITGVAVLAESHISIHTWPEISYVALDVFMCGHCDPKLSVSVFEHCFKPQKTKISEHSRGQ